MDKNFLKILLISVILLVFIIALPNTHVAAAPSGTPPPQITAPPLPPIGGGNSGGGGGGGGVYTPASFEKYSTNLKSSDGTVIGHIDAENFNSYLVWAEKNGTVGNTTYELTIEGELSSKLPDDCWLDINFMEPGSMGLPPGMENGIVFAVMNITKKPDGWSWKAGPKFTLKVSGSTLNFNPGDTYYLVRSSGPDYQIQKVAVDASGGQATIKVNPSGDAGIFTLVVPVLPTPTPTPTPTPVSTPTPTPLPESNWIWGFPIFVAIFAVGAVAGAAILFLITRNK